MCSIFSTSIWAQAFICVGPYGPGPEDPYGLDPSAPGLHSCCNGRSYKDRYTWVDLLWAEAEVTGTTKGQPGPYGPAWVRPA